MAEEDFKPLRLVGGTALALQLGHRASIDIDLFGQHELDDQQINQQKITDGNEWIALRSLAYFEDADQEPMPAMFQDISWNEIKTRIAKEVLRYSGI